MSNEALNLVAVDDGYAMTKVVLSDGQCMKFQSLVGPAKTFANDSGDIEVYETNLDSDLQVPGQKEVKGSFSWLSSGDPTASDTAYDSYPFSARNRVMVHHALIQSGLGGKDVHLSTSLPVDTYYAGSIGVDKEAIQRKNDSMRMKVVCQSRPCARIVESTVMAEGVSAWIDFAISDDGSSMVQLESPAAIIDIGGRTTDIVKVLTGLTVDKTSSGSESVGVLKLIESMKTVIARHPEIKKNFRNLKEEQVSRRYVEDVINTGFFTHHGMNIDMREVLEIEKRTVAAGILQYVEQKVKEGFGLEILLFVGGGSIVFRNEIRQKYPNAQFIKEPEYANARGMMKYMKFV